MIGSSPVTTIPSELVNFVLAFELRLSLSLSVCVCESLSFLRAFGSDLISLGLWSGVNFVPSMHNSSIILLLYFGF